MSHRLSRYKIKEKPTKSVESVAVESPVEVKKNAKYWVGVVWNKLYKSANFWVALIFGIWGVILSKDNDKLTQEMKMLATKQNKLVADLKDNSDDQYNMFAHHYNFEEQKRLEGVMNALNNITYQFADMESKLVYHRLQKSNQLYMVNTNVPARLEALEFVLSHLQKLGNVADLTDSKTITAMYNKCLNDVLQLKLVHQEGIALGYKVDTSRSGQQYYSAVMESVIKLGDAINRRIDSQRDVLFASMKEMESIMKDFRNEEHEKQRTASLKRKKKRIFMEWVKQKSPKQDLINMLKKPS